MVTTLHQACQEGNLMSVREHLDQLTVSPSASPLPSAAPATESVAETCTTSAIDAKDAQGNSALALAVQAGQREIVEELLTRGADRSEVLASGVAKSQPEILALLEQGVAVPVDVHGGHQLPDGTVSYMHAAYAQPFVPAAYAVAPPVYYYEAGQMPPPPPLPLFAPHGPAKPRRGGLNGEQQQQQHARKESVVNLPPPEVARLIPCRNFPNCRYGDQCAFAHPMVMGNGMPPPPPPPPQQQQHSPAAPSGSMSPPPQHAGQQIYYQPLPGYGYAPGPYGPGPQFYPMAPPPAPHIQYSPNGVPLPMHFQPPHAIPQPLPHDASHQHMQQHLTPGAEPFAPHFEQQQQQQQKSIEQTEAVVEHSQSPQQDGAEPSEEPIEPVSDNVEALSAPEAATTTATSPSTPPAVDHNESDKVVSAPAQDKSSGTPTTDSQGRPIHRRQSFNSFLHHHAVPFQPGYSSSVVVVDVEGMPVLASMPSLNGINGATSLRGAKAGGAGRGGSGRGGFHGSARPVREGSHANTRIACSFFARECCAYGDKCRFPHIQPDGSDARFVPGQTRTFAENQQQQQEQQQNHSPSTRTPNANGTSTLGAAGAQAKVKLPTGLPALPQGVPLGPQVQQQHNKKAGATTAAPQAKLVNGSLPAVPSSTAASTETASAGTSNGASAPRPAASGVKPASNGATQASSSKSGGAGNGARSGSASGGTGHVKGANGGSTSGTTVQRKLAMQRVPTVNDFPALPFSPNPTQPGSPALTASTGPAKVNFSAILSAPAPVKPKAEPKLETAKSELATAAAAAEPKAEAQKHKHKQNKAESHVNGHAAIAESKESNDEFKVVKSGKKSASSASAAAAAVTVAAAAAASQQKEHAAPAEGFATAGPTAVAA